MGGFKGSHIQKSGKGGQTAGSIATNILRSYADGSGNGHRFEKRHHGEHFDPRLSRAIFWGLGGGGSTFHQKSGECHRSAEKKIKKNYKNKMH